MAMTALLREALINSANEMKHEAHGTQQPRPINKIGEEASTTQRSDSLTQPINQRFLSKQQGLSFPGLLLGSFVFVLIALAGFKIVPPYFEYYAIEKNLTAIAKESTAPGFDSNQIRTAFSRRAQIDNITAISSNDIKIQREGNRIVLRAEYTRKIPLTANLSLTIDFKAQSE